MKIYEDIIEKSLDLSYHIPNLFNIELKEISFILLLNKNDFNKLKYQCSFRRIILEENNNKSFLQLHNGLSIDIYIIEINSYNLLINFK